MIVSFSIENWMSFKDKASFSMVASKERQHGARVPRIAKYQTRLLPAAALYGGNASGKTNFFKALNFMRQLVVRGTQPDSLIPVDPFRLNSGMESAPTSFQIELLVDEIIYEYAFSVTATTVETERLTRITSGSERVLFERRKDAADFHDSLRKDQFLMFAFQGTRENQLFLTNAVSQKIDLFRPVYNWFKNNLELIAPDSRFEYFEHFLDEGHPLYAKMNDALPKLDTGITHLGGEKVSFDDISLPDGLKSQIREDLKDGESVKVVSSLTNERYIVTRTKNGLAAKKLVAYHKRSNGQEERFEIRQESDGTQRVIDLLPAFLTLSSNGSDKVYVIDEVDRSLHSILTRGLLEEYLSGCSPFSRSQLLFTTHDLSLMDQSLFRRDEMWITQRDRQGASSLCSFSDYKDVRYDKDIRKSYIIGRLGGVPAINNTTSVFA